MTNYVFVYSGGNEDAPATEAEIAEVMAAWGAWFGSLGDAVQDGGNPFTISKNVGPDGVNDGPAGTRITGYSIVAANSIDEAVEMAKGCPVIQNGGHVSVYETMRM